jgi:hypothetical protein
MRCALLFSRPPAGVDVVAHLARRVARGFASLSCRFRNVCRRPAMLLLICISIEGEMRRRAVRRFLTLHDVTPVLTSL